MDTILNSIIQSANALSMLQASDGSVRPGLRAPAEAVLGCLVDAVTRSPGPVGDYLRMSLPDLERWKEAGLDTIPSFDDTIARIGSSRFSEGIGFLGVMRTPNSGREGYALEAFLGEVVRSPLVDEVLAVFDEVPPLPYMVRTTAGSIGFEQGECLVAFPENFKRSKPVFNQSFAVFIVDRFARLYRSNTLANLPLVHPAWRPVTAHCGDERLEGLRQAFAALHDREHENGHRPLRRNLTLKSNRFCAVLDEVRVDIRTAEDAGKLGAPLGAELAELIYLDRVIRLPRVPGASRYPDSVAGMFILSYLVKNGVDLSEVASLDDIHPVLSDLASRLDAIEALRDDAEYQAAAERFVREMVPNDTRSGELHAHSPWLRETGVHPHWPGGWLAAPAEMADARQAEVPA